MTPEEIAEDILSRCWWKPEDGGERPPFAGLDKEIAAAIRAARIAEAELIASAIESARLDPQGIMMPIIRKRIAELRKEGG